MFSFLVKRLFQALIVMFVISLVAFAIQDNLGDPLRELVGQSVSESERQALRDELGLNDPFITKYTRFVGNALQGDLGTSYFFKRPAVEVILDKLVATLELVFGATLIIIVGSMVALPWVELAGIIMLGHSAFGRVLGYGLKHTDAFKHTHLGWL